MKCIILAAGYAIRLYPLSKDRPKPLLKIGDRVILEYILDKVQGVSAIERVYIISNQKFYKHFKEWLRDYKSRKDIRIINDKSSSNEDRLGAIADLFYVLDKEDLEDDILVMAGDNLFEFDLSDFLVFQKRVNADCITGHELDDIKQLKRTGVAEVDGNMRVISFEEKPDKPRSRLAVPPVYIYEKETLPLIRQYLEEGNNPDAPGNLIPWLIEKREVYLYQFRGYRYDIGTVESYKRVQEIFKDSLN